MNIRQTIITTTVALTMVAMVAPGIASAALTSSQVQAIVQLLQSFGADANTIANVQATLSGSPVVTPPPSSGTPAACSGITFTRNLTVGATGSDVKCLQALLNTSASTQVSSAGVGSPGNETSYFGSLTLVAVQKYQSANGILPASQVGPLTRAKLNAWLGGSTPTPTPNPTPTPTGAGLTVSLASDNPAAGTVVDTQALATLAKFTFYNGDNAAVKVTSFKLKRIGIAADASLTNVYLFDGSTRLTDSASVASTVVNFNDSTGLFTVPAGGSKTISVLSDIDGNVAELVGVQVVSASDVTTNASSVKGTFPISGNLFTIASGTNLATIYFSDASGTVTPAASDIDPQNDYAIWYDNAVVGTRAVWLHRIAFRVGGSLKRQEDIKNFRLLIDGVQAGSAVATANSSDYVIFDLTGNPVKLETGTRVVKVLADIIGGSSTNVYLSLRTAADMTVVDSQVNANLLLKRVNTTTSFTAMDSGTQTINSGTLTVTKLTTSPAGDVVDQANNVPLARFELKAAGEKVKIESLRISGTVSVGTVGALRNGAVYANGVQIGSTTDIETVGDSIDTTNEYTTYNFGSSLIVEPGSPVTLEVRSDVFDNDGTNGITAGTTILIKIEGGDLNNATGQVSYTTVDVPSADVSANTVTARQGGLTLSKYTAYTNQTAVVPLTDYKLGHFTLTANTTEAVNVNTIEVTLNYVSGSASNLYVKLGNNTTSVKSTVALNNTWSVNYSLAAGQTVDAIVYGNVSSTAVGVSNLGMYVAGTTASSATSVTAGTADSVSSIAGQTITFATGTPTTSVDASTPLNQAVAGGQTVVAGKYKVTAQNDSYTIKTLRFKVAGTAATSAVVNSLTIKDGSTVLGTVVYDGANDYWELAGLNVSVPANTSKTLIAEYNLAVPYTDGAGSTAPTIVTTGKVATLTMDYVKVSNSQGTESEITTDRVGNYVYVYKTIPTFTLGSVGSQGANLSAGATTSLYKFNVAADAKGPVALKQLRFTMTNTDNGTAGTLSMGTFKFFRGSTDITSSVTIQNASGSTLESTNSVGEDANTKVIVTFDTEEQIPAGSSYDYTLKATPAGFITSTTGNDSTSTVLVNDTVPSDGTADGGAAGANQTGYFLDATSNTAIQTLATTAAGAGTGTGSTSNGNVIWSDNSAQVHDYTYTGSSSDWFNGYLLNNLPLDATGIVAQ